MQVGLAHQGFRNIIKRLPVAVINIEQKRAKKSHVVWEPP